MTKSRPETVGQLEMTTVAEAAPRYYDPNERVTFSRLATPQYWGLKPEDYADLTPDMLTAANPDKFRSNLINPIERGRFVYVHKSYPEPFSFVALSPGEYNSIILSPAALNSRSVARYLADRTGYFQPPPDREKAERAGMHVVERRLELVQRHIPILDSYVAILVRFAEAARYPGSNRGKSLQKRAEGEVLRGIIMPDMFEALTEQRRWTPTQLDLAKRSLERRLFFERQGNKHFGVWRNLLRLLIDYNNAKRGAFLDSIHRSQQEIEKSVSWQQHLHPEQ